MKLVLADGSIITVTTDTGIGDMVAEYSTIYLAHQDIEKLTPENLSHVVTKTDNWKVLGEYDNLILVSAETFTVEGGVEAHIRLRTENEVDALTRVVAELEETIADLNESQGVQDEAIEDLGTVVSEILEPDEVEEPTEEPEEQPTEEPTESEGE